MEGFLTWISARDAGFLGVGVGGGRDDWMGGRMGG